MIAYEVDYDSDMKGRVICRSQFGEHDMAAHEIVAELDAKDQEIASLRAELAELREKGAPLVWAWAKTWATFNNGCVIHPEHAAVYKLFRPEWDGNVEVQR